MGFVENFIRFLAVQKFENQLRFDKVTESLKLETFLRHGVVSTYLAGFQNFAGHYFFIDHNGTLPMVLRLQAATGYRQASTLPYYPGPNITFRASLLAP